jgi:hypothetical protein
MFYTLLNLLKTYVKIRCHFHIFFGWKICENNKRLHHKFLNYFIFCFVFIENCRSGEAKTSLWGCFSTTYILLGNNNINVEDRATSSYKPKLVFRNWGMLHIIPLSSFCPPKFDVVLKITIEFMIDHYWILIQW